MTPQRDDVIYASSLTSLTEFRIFTIKYIIHYTIQFKEQFHGVISVLFWVCYFMRLFWCLLAGLSFEDH